MTKKTVIEVVTQNTEDQLDKVGALRNVAVNDAWKRVRQKIQVKSWSEAEEILGEVINGLQKINMSKSMTPMLNKLKSAFKSPDQEVEETTETPRETHRETPRETPSITPKEVPKIMDKESDRQSDKQETTEKPMSMQQANELNKVRDGISELERFLRGALKTLDNVETQEGLQAPMNIPDVLKPCLNVAIGICDKCRQEQRVAENLKKEIADNEAKYSDLENLVKDKDKTIRRLTESIQNLEKKNEDRKEAKIETFKDQMKLKSYEKNLEQKTKEVGLLNKETRELKDRLNAMLEAKSSDLADIGNPYPPAKLAEMYTELYKKEWKDVLEIQKTSHKRGEKEAMFRLSGILKDAYVHCKETSDEQLERLMEEFVYPCDDSGAMKGSQKLVFDESAQKQLNNLRKQTCTVSCEFAKTTFISQLEDAVESRQYTLQEISDCLPFIEKCVELCWFCVLQTPPIVMETEFETYKDKSFDKVRYDPYSSEGEKVEIVVWPSLYYESDGTILAKGVAIAK